MSRFAQLVVSKIADYIQLRQSLGYAFQSQAATLQAFGRFVESGEHPGPLTQELALDFVLSCDVTPNVRAWRYGVLRRFAEYLSVFDTRTHVLDPHPLPRCRAIPPARILDNAELARLLAAARALSPRFPLRGHTLFTVLGLLASTGLRSGEALRLNRDDVDLAQGILQIRQTKFHKDRLVPVHPSTRKALTAYAVARDRTLPRCDSPAFFLSLRGQRLSQSGFCVAFHQARARAGLDTHAPRPLRPHDLRHRFAVTRLIAWHRDGVNVQARLPALATYLGHVRYSDTAYYVTATPELLGVAAQRVFDGEGGTS
jgi:integrase